jgi:hypothetical protein
MKALLLASVVVASLVGCDSSTAPSAALDQDFTLAPGDRASITGTNTRVRFLRVDGDSRCPAGAFCITGGDALVKIEVQNGGATQPFDLHTGTMAPITVGTMTIALVSLMPYPFSSRTIAPDEYRATLRVTLK